MSEDHGGSAFPIVGENGLQLDNSEGMSLRDYFAAKAMATLMAQQDWCDTITNDIPSDLSWRASIAFQAADIMLKERNK
jgi:hypothetical protein